ncbi:Arm DNA-binding domain-containing protein [Vibrio sonorensis]|uniref:Arm DNA-binding domain-containing protein n=1 Tax=Vibrio sonorensis TaxID=1004316 RepID=UPI003CCB97D2
MNAQQLENLIKVGKATRKRVASGGPGIYFRVASSGSAFWVYRYTINGVRKEITVGAYGSKHMEFHWEILQMKQLTLENSTRKVKTLQ